MQGQIILQWNNYQQSAGTENLQWNKYQQSKCRNRKFCSEINISKVSTGTENLQWNKYQQSARTENFALN